MPQLVGTISDSLGFGISGDLIIELMSPIIDTTQNPDKVSYNKAVRYEVIGGSLASCRRYNDDGSLNATAAINILNSGTSPYRFSFKLKRSVQEFYLDGLIYLGDRNQVTSGTNPPIGWYTGAIYNSATSRALTTYTRQVEQDLFIPFLSPVNDPTTTEWASLQPVGINPEENLITSLKEVAKYAANNYGSSIAASIFIPSGLWSNTASYPKFSTVYESANRRLLWKISANLAVNLPIPTVGQTSNTDWMVILEAPTQVSQTITLLEAAALIPAHDGNTTQAFSVNAIYDILQAYAKAVDTITSAAVDSKISTALSGYTPPSSATANDQPADTNNTSIANTKFVKSDKQAFITLEQRYSMGSNGGAATSNYNNRIINTRVAGQNINPNAGNTGIPDTICTNVNTSNGQISLKAGKYLVDAWASASRVDNHRIYLFNITDNADTACLGSSEYSGSYLVNNAAGSSQSRICGQELTLAADKVVQLRHYIATTTTNTDALGRATNVISSEIYAGITFRRLN